MSFSCLSYVFCCIWYLDNFNWKHRKEVHIRKEVPKCCFWYLKKIYFSVNAWKSKQLDQPFTSLPNSLYGSEITKQVFIANNRLVYIQTRETYEQETKKEKEGSNITERLISLNNDWISRLNSNLGFVEKIKKKIKDKEQ